jgi:phosphinothricin acetyltransferase
MPLTIRLAADTDAQAIAAIYAPYVENTPVSFEYDPPTPEEMASRIRKVRGAELPWLVATDEGRLVGYAYATRHKERAGYQWCVESSVYVDRSSHRTGIGRALYARLFEILLELGYQNVYAGTTLPNDQTVKFHESFGFVETARFHSVGFKHGKWHDTAWWHLSLGPHPNPPPPPGLLTDVEGFEAAVG